MLWHYLAFWIAWNQWNLTLSLLPCVSYLLTFMHLFWLLSRLRINFTVKVGSGCDLKFCSSLDWGFASCSLC